MARPMLEPAPVVTAHAAVCRDLFDPQGQGRHVPHELTGLMVLPTKRLAQIARCTVASADHTQLARFRSAAPWPADAVQRRRIRVRRPQTTPHRRRHRESLLARDATLCAHGGRRLDSGARPDHQRDGPSPLAHIGANLSCHTLKMDGILHDENSFHRNTGGMHHASATPRSRGLV